MSIRLEVMRNNNECDDNYSFEQTIGNMYIYIDGELKEILNTLELPFRNNEVNVSCIKTGTYKLILWDSEAHPKSFKIKDVDGRLGILLHSANLYSELLGCIALGTGKMFDINSNGVVDMINSKKAMKMLNKLIRKRMERGEKCEITIV